MNQPTPVSQRIEAMDMLRGVAVLGILLLNINSFALPIDAIYEFTAEGYHHARDKWVFALVSVFGAGKFMSLFALLFGAGVALMVDRRRQSGIPTAGLHYRRIAVLGGLGFLHGTLIWYGDILLPYAICGAILYPMLLMSSRNLVKLCVGLWCLALVVMLGWGLLMAWGESMSEPGENASRIFANEVALMRGGLIDIMRVRLTHWLLFMVMVPLMTLPWMLALMSTGVLACRYGWITGQRPPRDYRRLLIGAMCVGLPIAVARVALSLFTDAPVALVPQMAMSVLDAALLGAAWAAIVMLLAKALAGRWLGRALIAVGRMALTNYLAQSVICTLLFYGYGFGLFGSFSRTALLGVVAGVWALQLAWSLWWLSRHERGPVEAIWRRLTYAKS